MADDPSETRKLELEARRLEFEIESRRAELEEKRAQREADARKAELDHAARLRELDASTGRGFRFSTGQATVAAAVLALLSGVAGGFIQARATRDVAATNSLAQVEVEKTRVAGTLSLEEKKQDAEAKLERQKFETTLILKAIDTPDRNKQIKNLKFFADTGFISDPERKIRDAKEEDLPSPVLNPAGFGPVKAPNTNYSGLQPSLVDLVSRFEETPPDADALRNFRSAVLQLVEVQLNDNQVAALVSFAYNTGIGVLSRSNLLKAVNHEDFEAAAAEFLKHDRVGGRALAGLTRRRQMEAELFKKPIGPPNQ